MEKKLTPKQKKFVDNYIEHGNATRAAIEAGYSEKYAHTNAKKLLQNTTLKVYFDSRMKEIESDKIMDAKEALEFLTNVVRGVEKETRVVSTQFDVTKVEVEADLKTKISATKEILKRYPDNDKVLEQQVRKLKAEADIAEVKSNEMKKIDTDEKTVILDDMEDKS